MRCRDPFGCPGSPMPCAHGTVRAGAGQMLTGVSRGFSRIFRPTRLPTARGWGYPGSVPGREPTPVREDDMRHSCKTVTVLLAGAALWLGGAARVGAQPINPQVHKKAF